MSSRPGDAAGWSFDPAYEAIVDQLSGRPRPRAGAWVARALDAIGDLSAHWEPIPWEPPPPGAHGVVEGSEAMVAGRCLLCWNPVEVGPGCAGGFRSRWGVLCPRHHDEYIVHDGFHLRGGETHGVDPHRG